MRDPVSFPDKLNGPARPLLQRFDVLSRQRIAAGLLLLGWLLLAVGYWGPWVMAQPAGLRVLGLDLAEYVKFMAPVRSGEIKLLREVFYLPLIALSLSLSLLAHRRELPLPVWGRWLLNLAAIPAALAMLPPAWTPSLLRTAEFGKQSAAMIACVLAALAAYPLWRRLPARGLTLVLLLLGTLAATLPLLSFARIHPALDAIYGGAASLGRGLWQTPLGLALAWLGWLAASRPLFRNR